MDSTVELKTEIQWPQKKSLGGIDIDWGYVVFRTVPLWFVALGLVMVWAWDQPAGNWVLLTALALDIARGPVRARQEEKDRFLTAKIVTEVSKVAFEVGQEHGLDLAEEHQRMIENDPLSVN